MTLQLNRPTTSPQADESAQQANLRPNAPWCPDTWHQMLSQITDHNSLSSALLAALNEQKDESKQGWAILAKELAG